ncbi:nidogen-2 [Ictalurus furcatus]|uniref:nidogen-2 n=1 Tax=Ictalurus furcatus TaxID=66913 RepID=UPI0023502AE7|nr:nidogen-2 [Ictalurus furcatus]
MRVSTDLATLRSFIPARIPLRCESRSISELSGQAGRGAPCIADTAENVVTMWKKAVVFVLHLSCILHQVSAVQREELFPYGTLNGDWTLQEGDDETSEVMSLSRPMHFYDTSFSKLYVATNGIISPHDLPMEKQYVDDGFPTEFPVIAPFLADIDTSNGKGAIYYRQTESPGVLNRIAAEVRKGFPDTQFTPTHAIIATWENVAAYTAVTRTSESSREVNTFQAVVAYDEENTYALFLYPEDGLQFFGTRPKEMFNVEIELPARVGFTRGEIPYLFFTRTEGPYFSLTNKEQSVKNLYQTGNTGVPGVWLFHIGNANTFDNVIPAEAPGHLPTTVPKNQALEFQTTPEYPTEEYDNANESFDEETEYNIDPDFQNPDATEFPQAGRDASLLSGLHQEADSNLSPLDPDDGDGTLSPDHTAQTNVSPDEIVESVHPFPKHTLLGAYPIRPEGEVVTVEENINVNSEVIHYSTENKETCDRFQQTCSQNAYCTNFPSGYCCHCHPGFYGNGRYCLPDGAPQRVNGKVNGMVSVGSTPVRLDSNDLHAYIVVGDGRAYTAISEVPEPLGWALMPVTPIGGLFGWLFALKLPNSHNGFSITGAEFIRHADVTFYPGNQRLTIVQSARGLDSQNYLNVETHLEGSVPFVPPGASIQMEPFSETYQYYPSLITSNSVREFTIVSTQSGAEKFTFRLRQNITYRDCSHTPHAGAETLQLNVERMFAMYVKEERVLRYAITNKIGHLGAYIPDPVQVNPCYSGSHDCDTTAQCVPGEGQHYACVCATGYTGDGRNCYDVDECAEGLSSCGSHAQCVNLPGSHSCRCQSGFEYGHDSHTCIDVDECRRHPCHPHASCANTVGSFRCRCQPGFHGDGFQCHRQHIDDVRPKTPCEQHRDSALSGVDQSGVGAFVPQCDEEGRYRSQQCHGSTGHCWCVDSRGRERAGTRTLPGTPPVDCDAPDRPKTQCEHHRDSVRDGAVVGAFIPQCDEEGHYRPLQCHGSTGHCWCVDSRGQERVGTRTPTGTPPTNCDAPERPKTECEQQRHNAQHGADGVPVLGAFIPECDEEGRYRSQQCHGSTGHCWCVDSRGQERAGTRTAPGTPPADCDAPERPKTQCERHRDNIQNRPGGLQPVGGFTPECDEKGRYRSLQCHGSTGYCWCVDSRGQERAGTRTAPGTPHANCDALERPKTQCEQHRDRLQERADGLPLVGVFTPECDEEGRYRSLQCHGSTGYCWCVDSRGQERAGTRTAPGTPHANCDAPERPKTQCEQHRDRLQERADGLPLVGVFIPQCDEEGRYRSLQCHGSSGHCWCVDSRGQERAGTRTPPGTPSADCDAPVHLERPKTQCEQHRDRLHDRGDSLPVPGAFVPRCDDEGRYESLQCHGSTGHCWCVDSRGQEREGTRTPPGTPHANCDAPERPKTPCEQRRDGAQRSADGLPVAGSFVPQCDEEGHYRPRQCHGSTGHCWCVDSRGQERAGTRTPPGTPPANCDAPVVAVPTQRPETVCERWRASLMEHYGGRPGPEHFLPQCDASGEFTPVQCYGESSYCWCVDKDGREVPGTRSHDKVKPACIPTVPPTTMRPLPRPDVTPPPSGTTLLYAQGQQIGALPLNGTRMDKDRSSVLLALHGSIVVGIDYDCRERKVYWTDLAGRMISRAALEPGSEPEILINTGLMSPEGLAVDVARRRMFWVDSMPDKIESAKLDGSDRRVLFNTDLVNPRAIIVDSLSGTLYWTDWNREAPKIESSTVEGQNRRVLVRDGIGLPNALTVDPTTRRICWADAGTKRLECIAPDGTDRRVIHSNLNYPFSMVFYANHFYYTDWRRDGVIGLSRDSSHFTDEYLPDQRSHLYGITVASSSCL